MITPIKNRIPNAVSVLFAFCDRQTDAEPLFFGASICSGVFISFPFIIIPHIITLPGKSKTEVFVSDYPV